MWNRQIIYKVLYPFLFAYNLIKRLSFFGVLGLFNDDINHLNEASQVTRHNNKKKKNDYLKNIYITYVI